MAKFNKKVLLTFVLCISFLAVSIFSACNKTVPETENSSVSSTESVSTSTSSGNIYELVDRANYNIENLISLFDGYKTSDFTNGFENGTLFKDAKDYMLGDIFNSLIVKANESFPSGSDISKLLGYGYYTDGNWYNNSSNLKTHKVMNALLSYKLDKSESMAITEADLETYGETKIVDFCGYSKSVVELVNSVNPLVYYLINSTLNEWYTVLESASFTERVLTLYDMVGDSTVKDIAKLVGGNATVDETLTVKDAVWTYLLYSAIGNDYIKLLAQNLWMYSDSGIVNPILLQTFTFNGAEYTVSSAIDHLLGHNDCIESVKEQTKNLAIDEYLLGLYTALDQAYGTDINALVESYVDEFLNNPNSGEQTIEEIASAINLSQDQKETALMYAFDILAYVDTVYGQEIESDGLTLSDMILYINEFFAGKNSYNALTVKQISAFIVGLDTNDLNAFSVETIIENELAIKNEIEKFIAENSNKTLTLTYDGIIDLAKNPMPDGLTEGDIQLLNSITMESIVNFNGVEIAKTEVDGVDEYVQELLSINLYEMIFNLSDERLQRFKDLSGNIDMFGSLNYISNMLNAQS